MLTLNDGRSELWQWDTKRKLTVDAECSQVHFSNKVFGRSIDMDVVDGVAEIPDILLQTDKDLFAWAFVGTAENGYTKSSKTFKVNKRNKPADYVFTPPEQTSLEEIKEKIEYLESIQDPDAIKNAVEDYLEQNPVDAPVQSVNGKTGKVSLTALDVGAISQDDLQEATNEALAQAKASGEFDGEQGEPGKDGVDGQPGKDGDDYVLTEADKIEIAGMAAELVEIPDSGGNAIQSDNLNDRKKKSTFAMVSFMDDDCREEVFTKLWPVIQQKGIPYTLACAPYDIGKSTGDYRFLLLEEELLPMYRAGVKISCHHYHQENMDTFASEADYHADLQRCKGAFAEMGINDVDTLCYPQGVVVDNYLRTIKEFNRMGFTVNRGINQIPYESYHMKRCEVFPSHGLWGMDDAKEYVNRLEREGGWLIFMTHAWYDTFDANALSELIDYISGKGIPIVDIQTAMETTGNIIEIGRFRKPIEEMHEPFFVVDANGAVWANSVNTVAKSQVKAEVLNVKYHTSTYMKPSGSLYSDEKVNVKRTVSVDVPVASGEIYRVTGSAIWGGAIYAILDETKAVRDVYVDHINNEPGEILVDKEVVMPEYAKYLRVSCHLKHQPDGFVIKKITSI